MAKKKKDTIEFRFYEAPQREYVLALLGESWIREYGHDETNLHFHNLMEIGYCREGKGELRLNDESSLYEPAMVSVIPANFPHITVSDLTVGMSYWEYLFFDPVQIIQEMYPDNQLYQRKLLEKINSRASLIYEWENRSLSLTVKMIMEEMRFKKPYCTDMVKGLLNALMIEIVRINDAEQNAERMRKKTGMLRIAEALEFVRSEYSSNIKVEDLAQACHMSEPHFRRVFEMNMNMAPVDYINFIRIQNACDMMKKNNYSMDVIAQKCGFATTSTFNRNFKKFLGTSPYQWKIKPENYETKLLDFNIAALKGW